jgi:hypothetical protein
MEQYWDELFVHPAGWETVLLSFDRSCNTVEVMWYVEGRVIRTEERNFHEARELMRSLRERGYEWETD